jgi:hypothetical protein
MTATRAAAYSGAAVLLLAWLASAAGLVRQAPDDPAPERAPQPSSTATIADEVQAQTARLKSRLAAAPAPQEPLRNPFAFAPRAPLERHAVVPRPVAEDTPPIGPPAEPAIELIGIAEHETPDGVARTAIISALGGELFLVKEGEALAARYRVGRVTRDAVELNDLLLGTVRRLVLRDPL